MPSLPSSLTPVRSPVPPPLSTLVCRGNAEKRQEEHAPAPALASLTPEVILSLPAPYPHIFATFPSCPEFPPVLPHTPHSLGLPPCTPAPLHLLQALAAEVMTCADRHKKDGSISHSEVLCPAPAPTAPARAQCSTHTSDRLWLLCHAPLHPVPLQAASRLPCRLRHTSQGCDGITSCTGWRSHPSAWPPAWGGTPWHGATHPSMGLSAGARHRWSLQVHRVRRGQVRLP